MKLTVVVACASAFLAIPGLADYEKGSYANAREKADNTLKYAHSPNRLFKKISAGEMAIGGYIGLRDPQVCEIAGMAGLDYVWIDAEHRPFSISDLMAMQMALEGTGCASLVRVRGTDADYLKPILDIGIDGVIFPQVSSYEEALEAVKACRYPQAGGARGICVSRASGYGKTNIRDYLKRCETWPLIIIEIEDMDGMRALDRILTIDQVDAIMVGPSDLACSLGALKKAGSDEIQTMIDQVAEKTRAAGKLFYNIGTYESAVRRKSALYDGDDDVGTLAWGWRAFVRNRGDNIDGLKISLFEEDIVNIAKGLKADIPETVRRLKDAGITGFDSDYSHPELPTIAAAGLELANLYCCDPDFFSRDRGAEKTEHVLQTALRYGAKQIMIVPDKVREENRLDEEYALIREGLRDFVARAKKRGVTVTIEDFGNPANLCSRAGYIERFLNDIPDLRFALDTGNLVYAGRGEDIVTLTMRIGIERIAHLHLKDFSWEANRKYVTLGEGQVPNEALVRLMRGNGYRKWITLENPVGDDLFADTLRQIRRLRMWCEQR